MLNRIFVVDSVTLSSTGTAVSSYVPWDQTTRKLPTQVVVKATGQGAYVRLSNDNSAATNVDVLVQGGDHVVLSVQGRRWVSVLSDGASSTVSVGALSTGVSGSAASLDLAFAGAATLDPLVTFTRASTATYFNSAGVLTSAATNAPRFDYNPSTLAAQGLLIEESRTNSIRNNTMVGAVVGAPGTLPTNWSVPTTAGLTTNVIGTATSNGITYIDLEITGTTTGTGYTFVPEVATQIAATNGQTWTSSVWWSVVAGDLTNVTAAFFDIRELDSGGVQLTSGAISVASPTSTFTRITASRTTSNVATAFVQPRFRFTVTNSAAVNFTLRIGLPQLELGAFATSVIPTTTTALTRAADVATINTLSPWYNSTASTIYAEVSVPQLGRSARLWAVDDGSISNMVDATFSVSNGFAVESIAGGVYGGGATATGSITANTVQKTAAVFTTSGNELACLNAGTVGSSAVTLPSVSLTRMLLGRQDNGVLLCGWLRRLTYYPRALSSAELQTLTA